MQQNSVPATLVGLTSALILSACASVSPAGLIAATRLDPLNTPPTEIAVAVGVPSTVRLADGDAELRMVFNGGNAASSFLIDETAPLQLRLITTGEPQPTSDGEVVYSARLAAEDARRIASAQASIRALRAQGVDGKGKLSITVAGGCLLAPTLRAMPVSTWLQTDPEDGFVRLTRRQDLFQALNESDAAALRAQLVPCDDPPT